MSKEAKPDVTYGKYSEIRLKKIGKEYFWEKSVYSLDYKQILRPANMLEVFLQRMINK